MRRRVTMVRRRGLAGFSVMTLVMSTLVATGGFTAVGAAEAAGAGCPSMQVIGVRGSGETSSDGHGFGKAVLAVINGVKAGNPSVQATSIDYLAVAVKVLRPSYYVGNKSYDASVKDGIKKLKTAITSFVTSPCGRTTYLYLAGYSQGADVVADSYQALNSKQRARIGGTVLIADPRFNGVQGTPIEVGTYRTDTNGIAAQPPFAPRVFLPRDEASVRSYCQGNDPVCQFGIGNVKLCITGQATCPHFLYATTKVSAAPNAPFYTTAASNFLLKRWKKLGPKSPVVPLAVSTTTLPAGTQGVPYKATVAATGGTAPLTWSVASGTLPAGLWLSAVGSISGTPSVLGSTSFALAVHDSAGATANAAFTLDVASPGAVKAGRIASGLFHSCAVTTGGGVKCWGDDANGQLGNGISTVWSASTPVDVVGLGSGVASISAGGYSTCAVTTGGAVKCWGNNLNGQLGDGTTTDSNVPVSVIGLGSGVAAVSVGADHSCALTTAGGVKCWGSGNYGALGTGTNSFSATPVNVVGLGSGVAAISAGPDTSCVVTTSGAVKCWGYNGLGELGDGTTNNYSSTPVNVVGLGSGVASVTVGFSHSCAVTTAGAVKCWGDNSYSQLGDGTTTNSPIPVDVIGLGAGVAVITAGFMDTCAVTTGGAVKCWGYNLNGQLGDGTTTNSTTPVTAIGLGAGVAAVSVGEESTCAVTTSGAVECWGSNLSGQLGDGTTTNSTTPVAVVGLP
jgi:alpha-tubulin suppressor-like RCC1 family protein